MIMSDIGTDFDAYWANISQILAVLTLSLVMEIRILQGKLNETPVWVQLMQAIIWAPPLVLSAFLIPLSIDASRPGGTEAEWMHFITSLTIAAAAGSLVLNPALIFILFSAVEPAMRLKQLLSWRRWQLIKGPIEERFTKRRALKTLDRYRNQVLQLESMRNASIATLRSLDSRKADLIEELTGGGLAPWESVSKWQELESTIISRHTVSVVFFIQVCIANEATEDIRQLEGILGAIDSRKGNYRKIARKLNAIESEVAKNKALHLRKV